MIVFGLVIFQREMSRYSDDNNNYYYYIIHNIREKNFLYFNARSNNNVIFVAWLTIWREKLAGRGPQFIFAKECHRRWDRAKEEGRAPRRASESLERRENEKCDPARARGSETLSEYWTNTTANEETFTDHLRDLPRREYGLRESREIEREKGGGAVRRDAAVRALSEVARFFCNNWNGYNFRKWPYKWR